VALQLERPDAYEMTMVVPSTKKQLRRGLEKYYKERGLPMPTAQPVAATQKKPSGAEGSPASGVTAVEEEEKDVAVPMTDPLGCFLTLVRLPELYMTLYKQHLDLDLLDCLDETDFKNFGVSDAVHISTIRSKRADDAFMAEVEKTVEEARKGGNWQLRSAMPATSGSSPVAQTGNMEVTLSDDDDLESLMPAKGGIILDSDDDLPLPPKAAPVIDLDDDDL
jgi:hypothetical protein